MNKTERRITYAEALNEAFFEEMHQSDEVIVMGIDVGVWGNLYGVTRGLLEEFGEMRVKDTPISEAAIAGCGTGAALLGMRPVIEIMYIDFISIAGRETALMDRCCCPALMLHYFSKFIYHSTIASINY